MSDPAPVSSSIDSLDSPMSWGNLATTDFPGNTQIDSRTLIVLPIYSFADHGLGLPLDSEEILGSSLLGSAVNSIVATSAMRILPPLRFGLVPYGIRMGALDPESMHDTLQEITTAVHGAGYRKLVFWVTSPWNAEIVSTASLDARVALGMQSFVIGLRGIGLDLHPGQPDRSHAQAVAAHILGITPESSAPLLPQGRSPGIRPGDWSNPDEVRFDENIDGNSLRLSASQKLAALLTEIFHHDSETGTTSDLTVKLNVPDSRPAPTPFPHARRIRYLPACTSRKIKAIPAQDKALILIPVGAIEQHGPHLPLAVDARLGEAAAQALHQRLPADAPVWFGPSITFGKSNEHANFPGTVSISAKTLRRQMIALAVQFQALGFRQVVFLNTHGGNSAVLDYTLREIQTDQDLGVGHLKIPSPDDLSPQEKTWGFHAGEWETSLMLALAPDLVDESKSLCHYPARLTDPGKLRPESAPAVYSWITRDIAPDGVMGDATAATAAKGQRWFDSAMDTLAGQVQQLLPVRDL